MGRVLAMAHRPLWPETRETLLKSWRLLADDLISFLEEKQVGPVVGLGHSLGGSVSFFAAIKRPDLFSHLVLIEPVFLPRRIYRMGRWVPFFVRPWLIPPARISRNRRYQWKDKEEAFAFFRSKRPFDAIADEYLRDFVEYGTKAVSSGEVELTWSREWETHIYCHLDSPWKELPHLETPTLVIRGGRSNTLFQDAWQDLQQTLPKGSFFQVEAAGHLIPFEYPSEVTQAIREFLK